MARRPLIGNFFVLIWQTSAVSLQLCQQMDWNIYDKPDRFSRKEHGL
jgi:hypothetical protein